MTNAWEDQMFTPLHNGGVVVRRSLADVARFSSLRRLESEARRQGWHVFLVGDQVVIFGTDALQLVC